MQRVIGLMSGTSADGVDAALVETQEDSLRPQVRVLVHATYPYDAALRVQILAASYPDGHHLLFAEPHRPKLVQNIDGIANVTVLANADRHGLLAFDPGPGNMLIMVHGQPGNGPGVTGARRVGVLGKIVPA